MKQVIIFLAALNCCIHLSAQQVSQIGDHPQGIVERIIEFQDKIYYASKDKAGFDLYSFDVKTSSEKKIGSLAASPKSFRIVANHLFLICSDNNGADDLLYHLDYKTSNFEEVLLPSPMERTVNYSIDIFDIGAKFIIQLSNERNGYFTSKGVLLFDPSSSGIKYLIPNEYKMVGKIYPASDENVYLLNAYTGNNESSTDDRDNYDHKKILMIYGKSNPTVIKIADHREFYFVTTASNQNAAGKKFAVCNMQTFGYDSLKDGGFRRSPSRQALFLSYSPTGTPLMQGLCNSMLLYPMVYGKGIVFGNADRQEIGLIFPADTNFVYRSIQFRGSSVYGAEQISTEIFKNRLYVIARFNDKGVKVWSTSFNLDTAKWLKTNNDAMILLSYNDEMSSLSSIDGNAWLVTGSNVAYFSEPYSSKPFLYKVTAEGKPVELFKEKGLREQSLITLVDDHISFFAKTPSGKQPYFIANDSKLIELADGNKPIIVFAHKGRLYFNNETRSGSTEMFTTNENFNAIQPVRIGGHPLVMYTYSYAKTKDAVFFLAKETGKETYQLYQLN